jgi:hypothetical protein
MPYIKVDDQSDLEHGERFPEKSGELNFVLTCACLRYLQDKGQNYTTLNEIVGALECAKLEFYRRAVSVYENQKIKENGDIYV